MSKAPVAKSRSERNTSTIKSDISALLLFLDHWARSARIPIKTIVASELRRYCITPAEVNIRKNTGPRVIRGPAFSSGPERGGKSPVPLK
jgi:hypothetical protein